MDFAAQQQVLARRKIAAEHAGAELFSRGIWICPCSACQEARKASTAALDVGFCLQCGKPLEKRHGAKYCHVNCRVMAWEQRRKRRKRKEPLPLFEKNTVDMQRGAG